MYPLVDGPLIVYRSKVFLCRSLNFEISKVHEVYPLQLNMLPPKIMNFNEFNELEFLQEPLY